MKVLILNASPRPNGNIWQMLNIIREELESNNTTVYYEEVKKLSVKPCIACMKCRSSHNCVLPEDDAQRILKLITECDAIVIGAPCYWGNMPGQLKLLFDRMVYGMMGENKWAIPVAMHKGKKAVLISTSSTFWPFNILAKQTRGVVNALKEILKWSGFKIVGTIEKGGTFNHPEFTEGDRKKCVKVARKLIK